MQACGENERPENGKFCNVSMEAFGPCHPKNDFMYPDGKPCIFLKLNKVN